MPRCKKCGREIQMGVSCAPYLKDEKDVIFTRETHKGDKYCSNCNTPPGHYHH